jgi:transposase
VLQNEGIESHVVDPASIATSRRHRRAKTDRIDGETLLRTLLASCPAQDILRLVLGRIPRLVT